MDDCRGGAPWMVILSLGGGSAAHIVMVFTWVLVGSM